MEEMARLIERGGRGWWAELAHWRYLPHRVHLLLRAACQSPEHERRKKCLKQEGWGEEKFWARYLGESVSLSLACGQGGCREQRLHQNCPAVAGRRLAAYSKLRDSSFSQGRHQIKSVAVCTLAFATLPGQCIKAPGPTEPTLEGLGSPMTTVSQVALLYWSDLTFNLRWGFEIYHPTFPSSFLYLCIFSIIK